MTDTAWETYWRVAEACRTRWPDEPACRADVAVASGLTALATEAALRDLSEATGARPAQAVKVVRDPSALDDVAIDRTPGRVLGCSFSGRSAEVLDGLARLRELGAACGLHGTGADSDLRIPEGLARQPFRHVAFCATLPILAGTPVQLTPAQPTAGAFGVSAVVSFLGEVERRGTTPLFVAAEDDFVARTLLSLWLEYLQRPGFLLRFPEFTHDFQWAMVRARATDFAFVLTRPSQELSDGRFEKTLRLLEDAGMTYEVVEKPEPDKPCRWTGALIDTTEAMRSLARARGRDLSVELTYESVRGAVPR